MYHIETQARRPTALVIGASSDIGAALCDDWLERNWTVLGTYRTASAASLQRAARLAAWVPCDLAASPSVDAACLQLTQAAPSWDVLVLGPGLLEPIGLFSECDIDEWAQSLTVNFTHQLRLLHRLLPGRSLRPSDSGPTVLFFAGGGTNSAPTHVSAYTVSKIAMVKMVELLAVEMPGVKFLIVGPGWVNTKIHQAVLDAGPLAGPGFARTVQQFKNENFTPMASVVACCNTLISGPRDSLTGRNVSVAFDPWNAPDFFDKLRANPDMYKMRRSGNDN